MLIILRGPPGSGKSSFGRRFFKEHQIVSTDNIRKIMFDDINHMNRNDEVFHLRNQIVRQRLGAGLVTVADSMHLRPSCVNELTEIADSLCSDYIIVSFNCNKSLDLYRDRVIERNKTSEQFISMERYQKLLLDYNNSTKYFKQEFKEKFIEVSYEIEEEREFLHSSIFQFVYHRYVKIIDSSTTDYWAIGDIHACSSELEETILECKRISAANNKQCVLYSVGDIIDRGPEPIETYLLCKKHDVFLIQGNHEDRYIKEFIAETAYKKSKDRVTTHEQVKDSESYAEFIKYIDGATHLKLLIDANTKNIVCLSHPGIRWDRIENIYSAALYKDDLSLVTVIPGKIHYYTEMEELGLPSFKNIKQVFGHRYHQYHDNKHDQININIDSGVVFGNYLTAINLFTEERIKIYSKDNYMQKDFIKFPSISAFKDCIKKVKSNSTYIGKNEDGWPIFDDTKKLPTIEYKGTVKIHGTNASIVFCKDQFYVQSRNRIITPDSDNYGFATFAYSVLETNPFKPDVINEYETVLVYGEWTGPGVQDGVGVNGIPEKIFVVFNIIGILGGKEFVLDNSLAEDWHPRIYNIDKFGVYSLTIDFDKPAASQAYLIQLCDMVEKECPVAKFFGISGIGEGVVWAPKDTVTYSDPGYRFKVKGEKHNGSSETKILAPIDVEKVASISDFIKDTVTEGRLLQGLEYLKEMNKPLDRTSTGEFIRWITGDIIKEHTDVMAASYISIKDLSAPLSIKARNWYFGKIDEVT